MPTQTTVIPAKAGTQRNAPAALAHRAAVDSRLRGNDEAGRVVHRGVRA